jgi:hypothetical protein
MLQGFLPAPERSPYGKYQGKNDCNADQGKVNIEVEVIFVTEKGDRYGYKKCKKRS